MMLHCTLHTILVLIKGCCALCIGGTFAVVNFLQPSHYIYFLNEKLALISSALPIYGVVHIGVGVGGRSTS